MYQRLPNWVLGFHGCDETVGMKVLTSSRANLAFSRNTYDWLGDGIYFWENDPQRALQFATEGMKGRVTRGKITKPFVVGAVINLGLCCNLFDQAGLLEMQQAHDLLKDRHDFVDMEMPKNKEPLRRLDRAVIEYMHELRQDLHLPKYQTMRSPFLEGAPLYGGTQIMSKTHIQIAVRDPSCILGYFLPR